MQYQKPVMVQTQKLKLSPQLIQSIQLMALPLQELKFRIQEELEKNPALEVLKDPVQASIEEIEKNEPEAYEYFENSSDSGFQQSRNYTDGDSRRKFIEGVLSRSESLQDYLIWQLRVQPISKKLFRIGELLIHNLDENGFHREPPELLVGAGEIPELHPMIKLIQKLDPVGVCSKDYREALIVQIQNDSVFPDFAEEMIKDGLLPLLEKGKFMAVARRVKAEVEEVKYVYEFIRTLNPFPGRAFSTDKAVYVVPDLMVKMRDGDLVLILNDEEFPVLGVNPFFTEVLDRKKNLPKKDARKFINESLNNARWFIKSIDRRNETLLKISKAIIEFQRNFFIKGPKALAPLTLKDIAVEVSVHETTVSRISNAKYIQTEWGVFPLKYFFSNSISGPGSTGSRFSKEGVKERIKEIIAEDKTGHMSDQKISDALKNRGVTLARRTVAKYRKELDIDSSYER